jgi:hypothetical protein
VPGLQILWWRAFTATVAGILFLGCGDAVDPGSQVLSTSELLILALQPTAPQPAAATIQVSNAQVTAHSLVHDDGFNTPFLTVEFPATCLESIDGRSVGDTETVQATVRPVTGQYGFSLAPSGLTLRSGCGAAARFSFSRYGDLSVADGSSTYLDRGAYAAALDLWREIGPGRWEVVPGSQPSGTDAVEGAMEASSAYVLAAPR